MVWLHFVILVLGLGIFWYSYYNILMHYMDFSVNCYKHFVLYLDCSFHDYLFMCQMCIAWKLIFAFFVSAGSYSEWLSIHEELLQGVLCLLLSGLSDREVAPAAAIALRDVGEVCGKQLTCRLPELLPICQV